MIASIFFIAIAAGAVAARVGAIAVIEADPEMKALYRKSFTAD